MVCKFHEKNKSLYSLQFGFRSKHSTAHALIPINENIKNALDNHNHVCGVFIDLQKAFDTVNHDILIDKLSYYGIRGIPNQWFKSYLSNRKQYVSINGYNSDTMNIKHGVPQGSVLGPLLFLIYINDLYKCLAYSTAYHFADDTNLLVISKTQKQMQKHINIDLKLLHKWLIANKISLNYQINVLDCGHSFLKKNAETKMPKLDNIVSNPNDISNPTAYKKINFGQLLILVVN